jgi:hypothetical protein
VITSSALCKVVKRTRASLVCSNFFQIVEKPYSRRRARSSRVICARVTNSSIVEAIRKAITTAVLELDRARDLRCN